MLRSKITTANGFVIEVEASDAKELSSLVQSLQNPPVVPSYKNSSFKQGQDANTPPFRGKARTSRRGVIYVPWTEKDIRLVGEAVAKGVSSKGSYYVKYVTPAVAAIRESGDLKSRSINSIRQKTQEVVGYLVTGSKNKAGSKTIEALNKPLPQNGFLSGKIELSNKSSYLSEA